MARQAAKSLDQVERELEEASQSNEKRDEPKELTFSREASGLYRIRYTAGGEVPDVLKGLYTNVRRVHDAIENYKKQVAQQ